MKTEFFTRKTSEEERTEFVVRTTSLRSVRNGRERRRRKKVESVFPP